MLTRFLDWLDEAAGGLIRVAYLLAGITAVAVYFGAGHLPPALDAALNAGLPWALAFALETHTYLTARRVRAAWQDHDRQALRVNFAVLVGLVAFSAWNQLGYLYGTWQPPTQTPLALPIWLAYLVRALIVPTAFLAAAFLAPLAEPIATQIENEARATLADVFKIARKQRRRMLTEAERAGRDMTGALVELVGDSDLRRVISHAYAAIAPHASVNANANANTHPSAPLAPGSIPAHAQDGAGEAMSAHNAPLPDDTPVASGGAVATPVDAPESAASANGVRTPSDASDAQDDTTPPTGPGSPSIAPIPAARKRSPRPAVLRITPADPRKPRRVARAAQPTQGVRTGGNESLEAVARQAYAQGATSVAKMRRATGMSQTAASKWVAAMKAEGTAASPVHQPTPGAAFAGVLAGVPGEADDGEYAL